MKETAVPFFFIKEREAIFAEAVFDKLDPMMSGMFFY